MSDTVAFGFPCRGCLIIVLSFGIMVNILPVVVIKNAGCSPVLSLLAIKKKKKIKHVFVKFIDNHNDHHYNIIHIPKTTGCNNVDCGVITFFFDNFRFFGTVVICDFDCDC